LDGLIRETDLAIEAKAKKIVTAVVGEVNEKPGTSIHIHPRNNHAIKDGGKEITRSPAALHR
jgi:hypothetical protein